MRSVSAILGVAFITVSLSACETMEARRPSCNGRPYWCLSVANQLEANINVYLDGEPVGVARAQNQVKVEVRHDQTRMVNYCKKLVVGDLVFGLFGTEKMICTHPEKLLFDENQDIILYDRNMFPY